MKKNLLKKLGVVTMLGAVSLSMFGSSVSASTDYYDAKVVVEDVPQEVVEKEYGVSGTNGSVLTHGSYDGSDYTGYFNYEENLPFAENMTVDEYISDSNPTRDYALANYDLIDQWNKMRADYGSPITITSGYRSDDNPHEAKKDEPGQHADGRAIDVWAYNLDSFAGVPYDTTPDSFSHELNYFDKGYHGASVDKNFIHLAVNK